MATLSEVNTIVGIGEWLKSGFDYPDWCVSVHTIKQVALASDGLVSGECLENDGGKEVIVATGANCNAILLEPVSEADLIAGDTKRACLVKGPAVIDSDNLECAVAQKAAALVALAVLKIIAVNSGLTTYTTQTT